MELDVNRLGKKIVIGQEVIDILSDINGIDFLSKTEYTNAPSQESISTNKKVELAEDYSNFGIDLNYENGFEFDKSIHEKVQAYDESIVKYSALEGNATNICFSLIGMVEKSYDAICEIESIFVTKSSVVKDKIKNATLADRYDVSTTTNIEITSRKKQFLINYASPKSILLIDGPLLAGDGLSTFIPIVEEYFIPNNILSIFIVKNSASPLLCESFEEYNGKYNSDLHLVSVLLKPGQRTKFYIYKDLKNKSHTKAFCYIKFRKHYSPIRIEIPTKIYKSCVKEGIISNLMDLIYYYLLVQGNNDNPQPRPIAIAEIFSREALSTVDLNGSYKRSNLTKTMNQRRGMF